MTPTSIALVVEQSHESNLDLVGDPIVYQVLKTLGVELEIVECPWVRCLRLLELGEADIVDHVFFTQARARYLTYLPEPYIKRDYEFRFYALNTSDIELNQLSDLQGKSISTIKGDAYFPEFDHDATLIKYPTLSHIQAIQMVLKGRIDLVITSPALNHDVVRRVDTESQLKELAFKHSVKRGVFLAVSKQSSWSEHIELLANTQQRVLANRASVRQ